MSPLAHVCRWMIYGYRYTLSPLIGQSCRYQPTCSAYGLDAIARFGAVRGIWMTARRLGRCSPWGHSGYDPVPAIWPGWARAGRFTPQETPGARSQENASSQG